MKKTRMISVIAASLLTATVVFTGCGGGGSSVTSSSSSSSSVSSVSSTSSVSSSSSSSTSSACLPGQPCGTSSSAAPTIKTVTVSDGWILGATVKCKNDDGSDITTGVAASSAGTYEIDITGKNCPILCAKNGYIDVNGDGKITSGEPKAPQMGAPGNFSNITPFSTLIANGVSIADLEAATGLNAANYNGFDMAVPQANDPEYAKQAVLLSAAIAYIQTNGAVTQSSSNSSSTLVNSSSSASSETAASGILPGPRGILPGPGASVSSSNSTSMSSSSNQVSSDAGILPGPGASVSSSSSVNNSSSSTTILTYTALIERMKNGESIDQIIPQLATLVNELNNVSNQDYMQDPEVFDKKAEMYLGDMTGQCAENECVAPAENNSTSSNSSMQSSSQESTECLPGQPCGNSSSMNNDNNTSSSTSSSESIECLPGQPCGSSSSSTSSTSSLSSSSVNSSVTSSSSSSTVNSSTSSTSGGILPGPTS